MHDSHPQTYFEFQAAIIVSSPATSPFRNLLSLTKPSADLRLRPTLHTQSLYVALAFNGIREDANTTKQMSKQSSRDSKLGSSVITWRMVLIRRFRTTNTNVTRLWKVMSGSGGPLFQPSLNQPLYGPY